VWFTGLSSAGKSTIAGILAARLERRGRSMTLLDGDVVRTHLSKGLGFSKDDRDTNIRRIAFVAAEVVRHGGAVICAVVSPYESTREEARRQIGEESFVLVHVATPLEECERRDVKGLYAKARRGAIVGLTGIDDPYEPPSAPDLVLHTTDCDAERCADQIEQLLDRRGWL
jgi:sulfate adenylyltransferase